MMAKKNTCSRLRHRLALQQEVVTGDDAGGFTRSWQELAQLWAEIQPITGGDSRLNVSCLQIPNMSFSCWVNLLKFNPLQIPHFAR